MKYAIPVFYLPRCNMQSVSSQSFVGLKKIIFYWELYRCRYRTRRQLAVLSDDQLRDIGLSREETNVESQKPFWE